MIAHTAPAQMLAQADLIRPSLAETHLEDVLAELRAATHFELRDGARLATFQASGTAAPRPPPARK